MLTLAKDVLSPSFHSQMRVWRNHRAHCFTSCQSASRDEIRHCSDSLRLSICYELEEILNPNHDRHHSASDYVLLWQTVSFQLPENQCSSTVSCLGSRRSSDRRSPESSIRHSFRLLSTVDDGHSRKYRRLRVNPARAIAAWCFEESLSSLSAA
jgi:hypothetical protein